MSTNYPPYIAYPSAPPVYRAMPAPPRLHWGLVLVLSIITIGLFGMIWLAVQANWAKKVTGNSKPFKWCLAYALFIPAILLFTFGLDIVLGLKNPSLIQPVTNALTPLAQLGSFVVYIFAAYTLRSELESSPIDIPLGGVMTFFFSYIYFQYHLHDLDVSDRLIGPINKLEETPAAAPFEAAPPSVQA